MTTVFTNGLWKDEVIDSFIACKDEQKKLANLIVNVNEPEITPQDEKERQENLFSRIGSYCGISFNIYKEDLESLRGGSRW